MNRFKRIVVIVLDSVGIGELPDAKEYDDEGSNTLGNMAEYLGGLKLPNLEKYGLGNIIKIKGISPITNPEAYYGKMAELSKGKDTTTGHWEIAGIIREGDFPHYPDGFPDDVMDEFKSKTGCDYLWNKTASGTEIIKKLGEEHLRTKKLIVYTSADSVFQIAANEELYPPDKLYEICKIARSILTGKNSVARVIARPFIGTKSDNFKRTTNRRDFSLEPTELTILDVLKNASYDVIAIGKIEDIFSNKGITESYHSKTNLEGIKATINYLKEDFEGLLFANLVDFDMLYGHRRDSVGYAKALEEFDSFIPELENTMREDDLLILTADHGNDPTFKGTDHTREYVPLIVYHKGIKVGQKLGVRKTFADIAKTIDNNFNLNRLENGESFLEIILSLNKHNGGGYDFSNGDS